MSSTIKTIVILALLAGVIVAASYSIVKRAKPKEEGMGYTAVLMCANPDCKKVFEGRVIAAQPPPFKCKYCLKMTAYRAVRCANCGTVFPNVVREDPTRPESEELKVRCPECGYDRFNLIQTLKEAETPTPKTE